MSRSPLFGRTLAVLAAWLLSPLAGQADTCSGLLLAPLPAAPVGTTPSALATGDFNRDGRLDLAVADSGSNDVSILLGDGAGGFAAAAGSPILVGTNPIDVAVGDLDHDGFQDIVVVFGSSPTVQLLRGQAGAAFANAGSTTLGPDPFPIPTRILLGKFTSDADLDLVVLYDAGQRIRLYRGTGLGFVSTAITDIDTAGETINGGALVDFNRDGKLDVAVAIRNRDTVRVYFGNGNGGLAAGPSGATGVGPVDVAAGDVDRDGWPDLVTADSGAGTVSVFQSALGGSTLSFAGNRAVGSTPTRVALTDLDHNGILDLAVLDDAPGTPRLTAFSGEKTAPFFDPAAYPATLEPSSFPRGLVVGAFTADGRDDLAVTYSASRQIVVVEDQSGMLCARASFAAAPRSYPAGNGPVSSAAADFDHDGRTDLVVASANDASLRILKNVDGGFTAGAPITGLSPAPRSVAVADMNVDGNMDVVLVQGTPGTGLVRVYLGNGAGGLAAGASQVAGDNLAGVAVGDVNGDGATDVIAASEGSARVFVFLGNGAGGLGAGTPIVVGAGPHSLVAALLDANATLDLAVANSQSNNVTILSGNGDGTFVGVTTLAVGANPMGIAAADLDLDGRQDLVTADNGSAQVSVILRNGAGGYLAPAPYAVGTGPTAVALLNLEGDAKPDIAVTTFGSESLKLLVNSGAGTFPSQSDHTIRNSPQAITPIDADTDGLVDLAIPCRSADAVVVLINRPPGPSVLQSAPRVAVHDAPRAAVTGDFDADGTLDLAVANSGTDNNLSLLRGDGFGGFVEYKTKPVSAPEAIAAGDFNRDGQLDLAVSAPGAGQVAILFGSTSTLGDFDLQPPVSVGALPDDLVVGDFDLDGDLDIAVCDKTPAGSVNLLRNNGAGVFSVTTISGVGNKPTAIVAADYDRDGDLDLAVANDDDNNVVILRNSLGSFGVAQTLGLVGGDTSPVSLTAGDFDGDGQLDLAAAVGDNDHLQLFRNAGGSFTVSTQFDVPYVVRFVTTADFNQDGKPDLMAIADGLSFFRGKGGLDFDPPQTVVARYTPAAAVVADFDRDGRTDAVVLDEGSDEISVLTSTACQQQRMEVTVQPNACSTGAPPYSFDSSVKAFDEGGNAAVCASGSVTPSIVAGTGGLGAILGGPASLNFNAGVASFSGANGLTLDKPGRYKLQFQTAGLPPVQTGSFTLALAVPLQILGPDSVCPASSGTYTLNQAFDTYAWTRTPPAGAPFAFTPAVVLSAPPLAGAYQLDVVGRNECVVPASRNIYFGDLASVTLNITGVSGVCVDCIGGSAKAIELGGGAIAARQWGYRTLSAGPITSLPGETGDTYVLKGASFPGPGTYFVVVTSTPACGPPTISTEWMVTVVPTVPSGEVLHLAASSRGTSSSGENQLLWVNATGAAEEIRIRWDQAPVGTTSCLPPANINAAFDGEAVIANPSGGMRDGYLHTPVLIDTAYCYSVFVKVSGVYSAGRTIKARAFDATTRPGHSVKWAYATGGTAVAPPSVSAPGIIAMSNDRTVHELTRGSTGGLWPAPWLPAELTGVAHSRSPVVPFSVPLNGSDTVLFTADDAAPGFVHAIDARTGQRPWPAQSQSFPMTGAPGGMFTAFGGALDLLLVGTRDGSVDNQLRALKLADGTPLASYAPAASPGPIGPINGTPAIDYATRRVYFASLSRTGGDTLFCLELNVSPVFTHKWSRNLGHITGSPVLRGGRVYIGTDAGLVYSLDAMSGGDDHTLVTADGPVKGFLFPDRRNDDLIFASDTKVWSVSDTATAMSVNWTWTIGGLNPSVILYWPTTNFVYVGNKNGELYELDFTNATQVTPPTSKLQVLGGGLGQVGAPSLDIGVMPKLLIVGSEAGVVHGLEVPFP